MSHPQRKRWPSDVAAALGLGFILFALFTALSLFSLAFDDNKAAAFGDIVFYGIITIAVFIIRLLWTKKFESALDVRIVRYVPERR